MVNLFDNKNTQAYRQSGGKGLPVVWVLHNMPRSGGTLLSKCLGSMSSHVLLSEIHPDAQHALSFNALNQAQKWFGLVEEHHWQKTDFLTAISKIQKATKKTNNQLILRDWSHVDYLGPPVTTEPLQTPALLNALTNHFEVRSIQLVRHPLDIWLSLRGLDLIKKHEIDMIQFLAAYRNYLESTKIGFQLRYEDFLRNPNKLLQLTCNAVGLSFDSAYQERWFDFNKITGDTSNSSSLRKNTSISYRPRKPCVDIDMPWLEKQRDYRFIVDKLYPDE